MIKEAFITLYLLLFRIAFAFFKLFPLRDKTVFVSSFGDNAFFIAQQLALKETHPLIFLNQKKCKIDFSEIPSDNKTIYSFETTNLIHFVKSIYHLATSKYVFIDNYMGFLAAIQFRQKVKCIQLWHAAGAIKKFGWSEPETHTRSERAKKRFQQVYNRFQFIPVSSQQMADIFSEAFHLDAGHFLYTGVPQTDFYFDAEAKARSLQNVAETYPAIQGKKVVLYAPTFRKGSLHQMDLQLDMEKFTEALDESYMLLIRLHPAVHEATHVPDHPRILVVNNYPHINELLVASDILITDYSSIPFEFSLLNKKMIFFTYDLESYGQSQGLWAETSLYFPGPIAKNTQEVLEEIMNPQIDFEKIEQFRFHWNTFSTGKSTENLISTIYRD
ncbi:CDP-glycerol glycerophosphotransferase family protein [Planomicrobium sp. CPCC 101079]|uniref:CDP-glycerol glycerophosphotransferase family protein n=1 Tax=Planomicrobium sp. CPCC 101079 TaxID=2599618 RepID=UPI0011B7F5BA|nr:CDP-glycerol glycerophosphotransferase family protein [Planomicrobium sp. CPCC 101079]TWT04967.1 teichoic acid biosynthesis protein B [Planomicrobium sp. CPCC 101079]